MIFSKNQKLNTIASIFDRNKLSMAALVVTIAAGTVTLYHMYYQLKLTKLSLAKAQKEAGVV